MSEIDELKNIISEEKNNKIEREISDKRYAIKLVEQIVFWGIGLICSAVFSSLIYTVIKK